MKTETEYENLNKIARILIKIRNSMLDFYAHCESFSKLNKNINVKG